MRPITLIVIAGAVVAQPALAAPAAPSDVKTAASRSQPDEDTIAEAIRLLDVDEFDKNSVRSADLAVGVMLASMVESIQKRYGEQAPQDLIEQLRTAIHDFTLAKMRAHLAEMKRKTAEIYAQEFTKAELIRLRELHSDPVAVKARERNGEIQPRLMMLGVTTMRSEQPELDAKLKRIIEDYLAAHGKSAPEGSSS